MFLAAQTLAYQLVDDAKIGIVMRYRGASAPRFQLSPEESNLNANIAISSMVYKSVDPC